jgi:hypothetical protein
VPSEVSALGADYQMVRQFLEFTAKSYRKKFIGSDVKDLIKPPEPIPKINLESLFYSCIYGMNKLPNNNAH